MMEVYKKFFLFLGLTILLCLSASIVWSETMEDLIWRDGNYYKKFSDVPFNGKVNGDIKGLIKNGKKEGTWVRYYENGQLFSVSNYNMGRKDGAWITYNNKGMLIEKGKYKNDLEVGPWIRFYENGEIMRAFFSWHGYHSDASFDNIGGPNSPGEGRLGAAQFAGVATLHADKGPNDNSDDINQPSTTWFITSDGEIAVAGKDARSNEQVVKKYLKTNDRYAHADIHGAPSVVVKNVNGVQPSERSMLEACNFSLSYSKAWGARVSSGHSFWVESDKVSKTPNTGEFLAKGAFVIRCKRNRYRNLEHNKAIGLITYDGNLKFMSGPISSIEKHSEKFVIFRPGFVERKIVIRKLSESFSAESTDIEKLLPSGGFDLVSSKGIDLKL